MEETRVRMYGGDTGEDVWRRPGEDVWRRPGEDVWRRHRWALPPLRSQHIPFNVKFTLLST